MIRKKMKTVQFHVEEREHQCMDIEVIVHDTIITTLHLTPSESLDLVAAILMIKDRI